MGKSNISIVSGFCSGTRMDIGSVAVWKIDHEIAIEELVRCRGRGLLAGITLVEGVRARQKVLDLKAEIDDVQNSLFTQMNPIRGHPMIDNWMMQYQAAK